MRVSRTVATTVLACFLMGLVPAPSFAASETSATAPARQSNGGGGSKVLPIVLTLVGIAASAGVTYYAVKELKKSTPTTTGQ